MMSHDIKEGPVGQSITADLSMPVWWRKLAAEHGASELIRKDGRGFTYQEIDERSAALARGLLADGAGKGSRIGLLLPNGPEWVIAWLATQRIGAIAVTLSTFFATRELAYATRHADVSILLSARTFLKHDYCERLVEAFPALAVHEGVCDLTMPDCPFLRSIWIDDAHAPSWSRGRFIDLEARGVASMAYSTELLSQIEGEVSPADLGMLIYTSGSTSQPKGVVHSQATVVSKVSFLMSSNYLIPVQTVAGDRLLVNSPFFWVGGFLCLIGAMMVGATVLCEDDHSPKALLDAIRREKATHLSGSEAVIRSVMACDDYREGDLDGLKPVAVTQRTFFNRDPAVGRAQLSDSLGMTETLGPHSGEPSGALLPPKSWSSWGRALDGMELKIVDVDTGEGVAPGEAGELYVRGPWLMDGFYKRLRGEVFDADGFYATGDKCVLDEDGYLFFKGRLGGMIKTSGANVSPEEVEDAIRLQPDIVDVAVFPVADPQRDQMVVAVVAVRPGSALNEDGLKAHLRGELSGFKIPKRILFLDFDDFPRTPSNKIRKPALAAMVQPQLTQS
jgi:acyl-CoA synthetase (AMP-forming)/AMP-acid ligase II